LSTADKRQMSPKLKPDLDLKLKSDKLEIEIGLELGI
jgi:hypothetical protein